MRVVNNARFVDGRGGTNAAISISIGSHPGLLDRSASFRTKGLLVATVT